MDGTLIDSIGLWNIVDQKIIEDYSGIRNSLDEIQFDRDEFVHKHTDIDVYKAYCEFLINKYNIKNITPEELQKVRLETSEKVLIEELDFKPDATRLVLKLKELGFTLALATMSTQIQINIYTKKNKRMINQMNMADEFDLILTNEDVVNNKPDPEMYNKIMDYYKAKPEECLIFEDSYKGIMASKNAGVEVITIYDKYSDSERELIYSSTDYYINNFKEFLDYLEDLYKN